MKCCVMCLSQGRVLTNNLLFVANLNDDKQLRTTCMRRAFPLYNFYISSSFVQFLTIIIYRWIWNKIITLRA